MLAKKLRIIWKEKIIPEVTNVIPKVSFDDGINWISLDTEVTELRTSGTTNADISSITPIDNEWNQLDVCVPFAPESVPYIIEDSSGIVSSSSSPLTAGTYYVAVAANTLELVGNEAVGSNTTKYDLNISNICKFTITSNSIINIYVQYPDYINGILVYMGKDAGTNTAQQALDLIYVSNICGKLAVEFNTQSSGYIELTNSQYFPSSGKVSIDNYVFEYDTVVYDDSNPSNRKTKLHIINRITSGTRIFGINELVKLTDFNVGSIYSCLPPKVYPIVEGKATLDLYTSFDNKSLYDLGNSTKTLTTFPDTASLTYSTMTPKITGNSLKLSGNYVIDTLTDLSETEGTICFYSMIDKMPTSDICLFGNRLGLAFYLSSLTMKPYIKINGAVYTSYLDSRVDSINLNEWYRFAITWVTNDTTKNIIFYVNGYPVITLGGLTNVTTLENRIYLGGIDTDIPETFTDFFTGYIDDFRIYSVCKLNNELATIHSDLVNNQNKYSGLIQISSRMKINDSILAESGSSSIVFTGIPRFINGTPVIYKNGVKQLTGYSITDTTISLTSPITPIGSTDIVKVYSNEINDMLPGTLLYQINPKIQFDEDNTNIKGYIIIDGIVNSDNQFGISSTTYPLVKSNNAIMYILVNTTGTTWIYENEYTYSNRIIEFTDNYVGKAIKIYVCTQNAILTGYSRVLLEDSVDLSNTRIAYPINTTTCKFKFDLESHSFYTTPEVKELGLIVSKFSVE